MTNVSRRQTVGIVAGSVLLDQFSKLLVLMFLGYQHEREIIPGFFKFVHWVNTGAAWSIFRDNNATLAIVSLVALLVLFCYRRHFDANTTLGRIGLALMFGGIIGNLIDRFCRDHVVDFLYFYVVTREGREAGFPAFNVADTAICTGVGLLFLLSFQQQRELQQTSKESA
jgi:signal peptidase II